MRTVKLLLIMALAALSACKGGGKPPTGLAYTAPAFFVVGTAITPLDPTVTGKVTGYAVSPGLPAGLSLDATTGRISGTPTTTAATAAYSVTASNKKGSASTTLNIAVYSLPAFTTQPATVSLQAPATATFSVVAAGTPAPTVKWQQSADNGATWTDITGATTTTYTTPATVIGDNGKRLRAVASNAAGSTNSSSATLTVTAPPVGRAWTTPSLMQEVNVGNGYTESSLAMNAAGDAILVWAHNDGTAKSILASHYSLAGGWTAPAPLELSNAPAKLPRVAMDAAGNAFAIWLQRVGNATAYRVFTSRRPAGGAWGAPVQIDTQPEDATPPDIGMDANGNAMAVWTQDNGTGLQRLYTNRYTSGAGWATPAPLDTLELYGAIEARIAVNAAGQAVAAFTARFASTGDILQRGVVYSPGPGGWGPGTTLTTVSYNGSPQVAIDAAGNAVMTVMGRSSTGSSLTTVVANVYRNGNWTFPRNIGNDMDAQEVRIATDATGHAHVIWKEYGSSSRSVFSRRYTFASDAWNTTELVELGSDGEVSNPGLAIDGNGVVVAVWREPNPAGTAIHIWANRRDPVTGWGTAQRIGTGGFLFEPLVGADSNGNALAVWESPTGTGLRSQYFSAYR